MKKLFYNPIEVPGEIHIVSKCFGVDIKYTPFDSNGQPVQLGELFELAKIKCFEEVKVYFSKHNQAYIRQTGRNTKEEVVGWVSLKGMKNGGGYFDDKPF